MPALGPTPDPTPLAKSRLLRGLLILIGSASVALGFLGIFLPLLPTTPFLLLAAACYARASPRFYAWLLGNRWFGDHIRAWREGHGIPLRAKFTAIGLLVVTLGGTIAFVIPILWVQMLLSAIGIGVGILLVHLPTRQHPTL
jgi:uncharacterized membrane protein YbaN (DUF454 family)